MVWCRRLVAALVAATVVGTLPAVAQRASAQADRLILALPTPPALEPTAAGKPAAFDPELIVKPGAEPRFDCGRDLPCRVRLRGIIDKNGGVAVEGTAFTW